MLSSTCQVSAAAEMMERLKTDVELKETRLREQQQSVSARFLLTCLNLPGHASLFPDAFWDDGLSLEWTAPLFEPFFCLQPGLMNHFCRF